MNWLRRFIYLIVFIAIIFFAKNVLADNPSIIINEIMWAGSTYSTSDEWIELKNNSDFDIDVTGWKIENCGSGGSSIILLPENDDINSDNSKRYIIKAHSFFIISNYDSTNSNSILNIKPHFVDSSISLINTGNNDLILKNTTQDVIDIVQGNPWMAGRNKNDSVSPAIVISSMERVGNYLSNQYVSWQNSYTHANIKDNSVFATPGSENSPQIFFPTDTSDERISNTIILSNSLKAQGIVTNVVDGDTIHISINSDDYKIRLIGIDAPEGAGSSNTHMDEPYYQQSKQFVQDNISGQSVTIYVPGDSLERYDLYDRLLAVVAIGDMVINTEILRIGYAKTYYLENPVVYFDYWTQMEDYAKNNHLGIWEIQDHEDDENIIDNISDLPKYKDKSVIVEGVVNSLPGDFSSQYLYIEDETCGLQIYNFNKIFPKLQVGDIVKASGIVSDTSFNRLRVIDPEDVDVLSHIDIHPLPIEISKVNQLFQGKLISVSGMVTNIYSNYLILFDRGAKIKIEIKNSDNINISHIKPYDVLCITGVVYLTSGGNISILPRSPTDIILLDKSIGGYQYISKLDNILQIYNLPDKSIIKLTGIVNSLPGTIDKRYFYIQDSSGAIPVYNYYQKFPNLTIGDKIEVTAIYDKKYGRIKIDNEESVAILEHEYYLIPENILLIDQNLSIGKLVFVEGIITKKQSGKIIVSTNGQDFIIYLRAYSKLKSGDFKIGDAIKVLGILKNYDKQMRIVPRSEDDLIYHIQKPKEITLKRDKHLFIDTAKAKSNHLSVQYVKSIDKTAKLNYNNSYLIYVILLVQISLIYVVYKK